MVINHLLFGMILQVVQIPCLEPWKKTEPQEMFGSPNTSQGFWQEAIGSSTLLANLPRDPNGNPPLGSQWLIRGLIKTKDLFLEGKSPPPQISSEIRV